MSISLSSLANTPFLPAADPFGGMQPADKDSRYANFTSDLAPLGDTITGTPTITISRVDGATMGGADLALISNTTTLDATARIVYFWLQAGTNTTVYWVAVKIVTTAGRNLSRTGYLGVAPQVG